MKTRNGFVSNSSSSSFVIAVKESKKCKHCGHKKHTILDSIRHATEFSYDTGIDAEGLKEVLNWYGEDFNDENDEVVWRKLKEYQKKHPKETLAAVHISNHDERLLAELQSDVNTHVIKELY